MKLVRFSVYSHPEEPMRIHLVEPEEAPHEITRIERNLKTCAFFVREVFDVDLTEVDESAISNLAKERVEKCMVEEERMARIFYKLEDMVVKASEVSKKSVCLRRCPISSFQGAYVLERLRTNRHIDEQLKSIDAIIGTAADGYVRLSAGNITFHDEEPV